MALSLTGFIQSWSQKAKVSRKDHNMILKEVKENLHFRDYVKIKMDAVKKTKLETLVSGFLS